METVKKRGQFRQHEPYATRDVNWYMDWKIDGYIQYLDEIDPVGIYTLEYDTDIPTKEELLNGIDQNHIQRYSTRPKAVDKEEEKDNTNWFFESEIVLHDEEEPIEEIKETIKSGSVIEQLVLNAKFMMFVFVLSPTNSRKVLKKTQILSIFFQNQQLAAQLQFFKV